jgi:hypothetical protein
MCHRARVPVRVVGRLIGTGMRAQVAVSMPLFEPILRFDWPGLAQTPALNT